MATGISEEKQIGLECGKWVTRCPLIVRVAGIARCPLITMVMSKGQQAGLEDGQDVASHTQSGRDCSSSTKLLLNQQYLNVGKRWPLIIRVPWS